MTEGTTQSVEERAPMSGPIWDAYGAYDSDPRVHGIEDYEAFYDAVSGAANVSLIDTDELAQLRAEHEALVAFSEMTAETCPRYCAYYIASTSFSADFRSEYNMKRAAVAPILARRRAAQEGE